MKLRIPGFRNTRAKVARRAAPVLRFLAAPRRPPLKVIEGPNVTLPATSYVAKLRAYSTSAGKEGSTPGQEGARRAPLRRMSLSRSPRVDSSLTFFINLPLHVLPA